MLDIALAICLIAIVPADALWRSVRARNMPTGPRSGRYYRTMAKAAALITVLLVDWIAAGRSIALLGFDWPIARAGWIGLAIAAVVLIVLIATSLLRRPSSQPKGAREMPAIFPRTPAERLLFVVMIVILGISWEVLYRGFLLWMLAPHVGMGAGVAIAATAYALAHGYQGGAQFGASLVSAFAFTIGYALTASLWWLIVLHIGLPLSALLPRPIEHREIEEQPA